ncbi:MAG TPA: hypothetical protein VFA48_14830 [Gammaproteobacteria bacterium]|nr:hypothetical protein [Gammaproteobacteria bacterium]
MNAETRAPKACVGLLLRFVKFAIGLPDNAVQPYAVADLPACWDEQPPRCSGGDRSV